MNDNILNDFVSAVMSFFLVFVLFRIGKRYRAEYENKTNDGKWLNSFAVVPYGISVIPFIMGIINLFLVLKHLFNSL